MKHMDTRYIFSDFGTKLTGRSGILQLMDDLGRPLPEGVTPYRLGGGNPARVPEAERLFRREMERIMADGDSFEQLISQYDAPQGRTQFIEAVASFLSKTYGWKIGPENVAVSNGSQSAFFYLFNLFSGTYSLSGDSGDAAGGSSAADCFSDAAGGTPQRKKILFPLVPEYVGYADQGIEPDTFEGIPARCEYYEDHTFKYFIDFEKLEARLAARRDVGALCVSRPTNPTGNVLTDFEIKRLASLASRYQLPLFVDNAYGLPFPDIVFIDDAAPYWDESVVLSMSLSKIGLPTLRTGIIVADAQIISALSNLNAIAALASGTLGQALAENCIASGRIVSVAHEYVRPFYKKRSEQAQRWIHEFFAGGDYAVHKSEGAIFLWLLLKDLAIPAKELYGKLKERGVITVPGECFFFGAEDPANTCHGHFDKCLRVNYSGPEDEVREGLRILAEVYKENRIG